MTDPLLLAAGREAADPHHRKHEECRDSDCLLAILQKSHSRTGAGLSDPAFINRLRAQYETSLGTLLPIKDRLAKTDWLIDQVVYRLYGLTDDDIATVEGEK